MPTPTTETLATSSSTRSSSKPISCWAAELMRAAQHEIGFEELRVDEDVAKVSVVGVGMRSHAGVAQTMFKALADKGVKFQAISTSEIKISVLIDAAYAELAVRALHSAYGLEAV